MAKSDDQPRDAANEERWFGGRRWTGYAAVGFVVVLAVCAGILILLRHGSPPAAGQTTVASTAAPPVAVSTQAGGTSMSLPPGTTSSAIAPTSATATPSSTAGAAVALPSAAPAGTVWQLVAGQAIPSQAGVGPAKVDGYTASGYAHTPLGALYAAANDFYRVPIAVSAQADWRTPLAVMVAPGPGEKVLEALRAPMDPEPIGTQGMGMNQLAAYKYVSYANTDAVIQLVFRDVNGGLHVGPIHVQWITGDWRVMLTSDGTIGGADAVINALDGFTPWQGVG